MSTQSTYINSPNHPGVFGCTPKKSLPHNRSVDLLKKYFPSLFFWHLLLCNERTTHPSNPSNYYLTDAGRESKHPAYDQETTSLQLFHAEFFPWTGFTKENTFKATDPNSPRLTHFLLTQLTWTQTQGNLSFCVCPGIKEKEKSPPAINISTPEKLLQPSMWLRNVKFVPPPFQRHATPPCLPWVCETKKSLRHSPQFTGWDLQKRIDVFHINYCQFFKLSQFEAICDKWLENSVWFCFLQNNNPCIFGKQLLFFSSVSLLFALLDLDWMGLLVRLLSWC